VAEQAGMIAVVHVITRLTLGGSSENTVSTMEALERAGYAGTLALGPESETATVADARRRGCRVVEIGALGREIHPARDVAAVAALWRLFRRARPALVHTHTSKAGFVGRLAARLAGVPAVIHQPHGHVFYGYWGPRRTALFVALERLAARWTDTIVTLTPREAEEHLERRIGRPAQYAVVPSGVPTAALRAAAPTRAAARARLGLAADAFVIAGVGRLVAIKGFDLLVAALPAVLARVPSACLLLIGDGEARAALEARAVALGVAARLRITGALDDVTAALAAADVLAAPSRNEGMGRVLVEAMALGLPVVGAAVGGIPDVIVDGECGRLVPAEDVGALAEALSDLGVDAVLRAKLGAAAMPRAEAFSTAVAGAAMASVYDALLRARGRPR
jgi:glycosyltransferase involved in cell wall biosynthesis